MATVALETPGRWWWLPGAPSPGCAQRTSAAHCPIPCPPPVRCPLPHPLPTTIPCPHHHPLPTAPCCTTARPVPTAPCCPHCPIPCPPPRPLLPAPGPLTHGDAGGTGQPPWDVLWDGHPTLGQAAAGLLWDRQPCAAPSHHPPALSSGHGHAPAPSPSPEGPGSAITSSTHGAHRACGAGGSPGGPQPWERARTPDPTMAHRSRAWPAAVPSPREAMGRAARWGPCPSPVGGSASPRAPQGRLGAALAPGCGCRWC